MGATSRRYHSEASAVGRRIEPVGRNREHALDALLGQAGPPERPLDGFRADRLGGHVAVGDARCVPLRGRYAARDITATPFGLIAAHLEPAERVRIG